MMLKWTLKSVTKLAVICSVLMLLVFARITFALEAEWSKRLIFCGLSIFFVMMGMLELFLVWRGLEQYSDELVKQIDDLLKGKPVDFFFRAPGSPAERLHAQFERLSKILEEYVTDNRIERDEIQSLIADIAHQAKTPIANIQIYAGILKDRDTTPDDRRFFLSTIDNQAEKLEFLLESLVKMSQLETGVIQIKLEESPIYPTIADALYAITPKAEAKNISISLDCDDELLVCHDPKWTAEAIFNLLDNAVKYTPYGGAVDVRVQRGRHATAIAIEDNGIGIEEDQQEAVFDRFYHTADMQEEEGIGIGLFLTRKIIVQQGGSVQLQSQPGVGSVFTILFRNQ